MRARSAAFVFAAVVKRTKRLMATVSAPTEVFRKDYAPLPYAIDSVDLSFDIVDESKAFVTSKLKFGSGKGELRLDGEDLILKSLKVNGEDFDGYEEVGGCLSIQNPPDGPFELETVVELDPKANTQLSGLYASSGNLCTQCEAEGFRRITYFYDRPDMMSKYKVRVEAEKSSFPVLLSNGNEVGRGEEGTRHWAEFVDPFKKPSYLFALVAGDLGHIEDEFVTMSGRKVKLFVWSEHHNVPALEWSMHSLKTSMKWDEDTYGREYDLDVYHVVAVEDFNMGAMENKGLNVFNTACVLAKPATATDGDYERVLGVVAHEYFHNWSGNRVTCRDWFQLTLKEGLTVFRDQHFSEDVTSRAAKRIEDVRIIRSAQFAQDKSPMKHPIRPESYVSMDNFYTVTVYNKGAEVIRMYKTLLGEEKFRAGMDLYFERHDGQAVTCDDFRKAMADASGVDLDQFEQWYLQSGTPVVKVARGDDNSLTFTQSSTPPLHIPIRAAVVDGTTVSEEVLFELTESSQTFKLPGKGVPSLLRQFSAPVQLDIDMSIEDLETLAAYDNDPFVKWDAWQQLATKAILEDSDELPGYLVNAFKATLASDSVEPSLRAYSLALPDFSTISLGVDPVDPAAICAALKKTKKALAEAARDELEACYESLQTKGPFSPDAESVGKRRLRSACLGYLSKLDGGADLCSSHFKGATCMSDSIAAAALLAGMPDSPQRDECLAAFYEEAKKNNEALVINKWFSIQAMADREDALDIVKKLLEHPDFSYNPNRFRSIVNTFAGANPNNFHAENGSGYAFVADQVISVDKINPQVAARLCTTLGSWRRYEPVRSKLMQDALQKIKDTEGLSKDTMEIATRSLA